MGRVCVSSCRWCVFVSVVHPVAILSAVFCVICSLLMFVSDASGDHMVEKIGPPLLRQFYWCLWCWSVRCVYVEECG